MGIFQSVDYKCVLKPTFPVNRYRMNYIDKESREIDYLLSCARSGKWSEVWKIIGTPSRPRKSYLINVIPEQRRWGVLHQAVYQNNVQSVRRLLRFPQCESEIKTKLCGRNEPSTPFDIARCYYRDDKIQRLLRQRRKFGYDEFIPTFQRYAFYSDQYGLCLISVTLAAYRQTFHPDTINPHTSVLDILWDIWQDMHISTWRWEAIKNIVADAVYPVSTKNSKHVKKSRNVHDFCKRIIRTYTEEENRMYTYLSMAFRRQKQYDYAPTGDDLGLGPYAVVYQMLLLFWEEIPKESGTTYRRMLLTEADSDKYQVHTKFVWQSIVSSSTRLENALTFPTCGNSGDVAVIFTIDNRTSSPWQPRNIERYACYLENERTYPAGARFLVTGRKVKNGDVHVALRLLEK